MAHSTQISFRIDDEIKQGAERVLDELGLSMSAAITVFLKKVARENRIPFDLSVNSLYEVDNLGGWECMESMTITEVARLIDFLRAVGLEAETINDCIQYIATGTKLPNK